MTSGIRSNKKNKNKKKTFQSTSVQNSAQLTTDAQVDENRLYSQAGVENTNFLNDLTQEPILQDPHPQNVWNDVSSAAEAISDPVFLHDKQGKIIHANPACIAQAGQGHVKNVIGQFFWDVLPFQFDNPSHCRLCHGQAEFADEIQHLPNGVVIRSRTFVTHDAVGNFVYCVHILENITKFTLVDRFRRENESLLRSITNAARDAIVMLNQLGRIVYWNPAAIQLFGYARSEAVGGLQYKDLAPEGKQLEFDTIFETLRDGTLDLSPAKFVEVEVRAQNGKVIPVEISIAKLELSGNWHALAIIRDITKRLKSENALKQTQRYFNTVVETAPIIIWAMDRNGIVTFSQGSGLYALGVKPGELVGVSAFVMYKDTPEILNDLRRALNGEEFTSFLKMGDIYFESRYKPLWVNGEITGTIGVALDVTKRERSQEIVRTQAQILEQINDAVVATEMDGRITLWNKGAERIYGYSSSESIGQHISLIYPKEEDQEFLQNSIIAPLLKNGVHQVDVNNQLKSGKEIYVHLSLSLLRDKDGMPTGMIGYSVDITERKRHEKRILQLNQQLEQRVRERTFSLELANRNLARNEEQWRATVDSLAEGVIVEDQRGGIISLNPEAEKLLDISQDRLLGMDVHDVFHKKNVLWQDMLAAECPICTAMVDGIQYRSDNFRMKLDSGATMDISVTVNTMESQGNRVGSVTAIADISERKVMERLKDDLLSTVSHELRTPLTSLIGFVDLLIDREYPKEKQLKLLSVVRDEGQRLNSLIDDFLDIQRIGSKRQKFHFTPLNIDVVISDIVELFSKNDNGCFFTSTVEKHLIVVNADDNRIRQVLKNLVSNAVKFSPNGGQIIISARNAEGGIEISVRDEGIGIANEYQAKLFKKFYRAENVEKQFRGTGLGLALVKDIVEHHGGRVWVDSEKERGSTFSFYLPQQPYCPI